MDLLRHVASCLSFNRETAHAACLEWAGFAPDHQRAVPELADSSGLSLYLWRAAQTNGVADAVIHAAEYRERRRKNEIRLAGRHRTAQELADMFFPPGLSVAILKG